MTWFILKREKNKGTIRWDTLQGTKTNGRSWRRRCDNIGLFFLQIQYSNNISHHILRLLQEERKTYGTIWWRVTTKVRIRGPFFGTKGPKWGCFPCGKCVACPNIIRATHFENSDGTNTYTITQHITCQTKMVVYYATCPCTKIYVGLTTRELKVRVPEHVQDILLAKEMWVSSSLSQDISCRFMTLIQDC